MVGMSSIDAKMLELPVISIDSKIPNVADAKMLEIPNAHTVPKLPVISIDAKMPIPIAPKIPETYEIPSVSSYGSMDYALGNLLDILV